MRISSLLDLNILFFLFIETPIDSINMNIRCDIVSDKDRISLYAEELWRICKRAFPIKRARNTSSFFYEDPKMRFMECLMAPNHYVVIAHTEEAIVAFIIVEKGDDEGAPPLLTFVSTASQHQRRGYMRQLLTFFLKRLRGPVELDVYRENPAFLLYSALGFRVIDVNTSVGFADPSFYEDGEWSERVRMRYE